MKLRSLFLTVGSVWLISACGARTNEEEFLGYSGGVRPGTGGGSGSGGAEPIGSGGRGAGGFGAGGFGVGGGNIGVGGLIPAGGQPGLGGSPAGGAGGTFPINTCCEAHASAGCNVPFVEECTCNLDSYCCDTQWDDRCVQVADRACLAACGASTGGAGGLTGSGGSAVGAGGTGTSDPGNCCTAHPSPGCQNTGIQQCVCGGSTQDTFCCNSEWDEICAFEAENKCGAMCSSTQPGSGGDTSTGGSGLECDFAGECGSCLCDNCPNEIADCQGDVGCLAIAWCVQSTMCLPTNCYDPSTCGGVIDQFGGLNGPSVAHAFDLSLCLLGAGCACQ